MKTQPMRRKCLNLPTFFHDQRFYMSTRVLRRFGILFLTNAPADNILNTLSTHLKGGIGIPFSLGFQKPHSAVFLCPHKTPQTVSICLFFMVGCIGESKDSPFQSAVCQPDTTRHPMIGIISGGKLWSHRNERFNR